MSLADDPYAWPDPADYHGKLCAAQAALSRVRELAQRWADDESAPPLQRLTKHIASLELTQALEGKYFI